MSVYVYCRMAVRMPQVDDRENADLLDMRQGEFLCPVCRQLGTALLPALAPKPPSRPMLPSQAKEPSSVLPDEATQQQAGPAGEQAGTEAGATMATPTPILTMIIMIVVTAI